MGLAATREHATVNTVTHGKEKCQQSEAGQETEACWQVEKQMDHPEGAHYTEERTRYNESSNCSKGNSYNFIRNDSSNECGEVFSTQL